jgi:hypothetical protein
MIVAIIPPFCKLNLVCLATRKTKAPIVPTFGRCFNIQILELGSRDAVVHAGVQEGKYVFSPRRRSLFALLRFRLHTSNTPLSYVQPTYIAMAQRQNDFQDASETPLEPFGPPHPFRVR